MSFDFNKARNSCTIKMEGLLTSEQILHAFDAVVSHKNYKAGMARIWNFREADLSLITTDSIMAMAQYSMAFPKGVSDVKVVFVVKRDLEYGLARMFKSFASKAKTPIKISKSIEEAIEWINS